MMAAIFLSSCKYDDSDLWSSFQGLEERIARLEELCKQMNTNITSLQTLVEALQEQDYITAVIPVDKDGATIGYTITFTQSDPITIYHGEDGKPGADGKPGEDGSTPVIGVRQDTDGVYYWTLDGDWLTDASGERIRAEGSKGETGEAGKPGKDGTTPQLKIENDYWYISYDNGDSWTQLGKATGEKGDPGEPGKSSGIFRKVEETDHAVIFTLNDGSTITIPKAAASEELEITFGNAGPFRAQEGETYEIAYTILGADETTQIEVVAQNYYRASVVPADYRSGKIIVRTPTADLETSRVLVFVSRGTETIMRIIRFEAA